MVAVGPNNFLAGDVPRPAGTTTNEKSGNMGSDTGSGDADISGSTTVATATEVSRTAARRKKRAIVRGFVK